MAAVFLTKDGFKKLEDELKTLQKVTLPDIKKRMATAREDGDLSENNAWITAKEEMEIARLRVTELKQLLKEATLVTEDSAKSKQIKLGDVLEVAINGNKLKIKIVPTLEADPLQGHFSEESPIGKAIVGKEVGAEIAFSTPAGEQTVKILKKI